MAGVTFDHVTRRFGDVTAVHDLSLSIQDGELMVLVGPSGCGKTTCLRLIAGLEDVSEGTLSIGDRVVNDVGPKDRDVAMVFQGHALYPHMNVYDNLAFGLRRRNVERGEIDRRVRNAAETIQLTGLLDRRPDELSGGEGQRVALGRAIVREPAAFLMDEPLSNLDAQLRVQTRAEIARLHRRLGATIVYVTHDQVEAMTMGQRIAVMRGGMLQQVGPPQELYDRPCNRFVAGFIGSPAMNFLPVELAGTREATVLRGDGVEIPLPLHLREAVGATPGTRFIVGIRPEHLDVASAGGASATVQARADVVEYLGNQELLHVAIAGTDVVALVSADRRVRPNDVVTVHIPLDKVHLFDAATELSLRSTAAP